MISVVVISKERAFIDSIQRLLTKHDGYLTHYTSSSELEEGMRGKPCDVCLLDLIEWNEETAGDVAKIKELLPVSQVIAVARDSVGSWENQAYEAGVDYVAWRPFHEPLLNSLFSRMTPSPPPATASRTMTPPSFPDSPSNRPNVPDLETLRDLSRILSHSLDYESLVEHFVLKVREIIGVNRVAVFLEPPKLPMLSSSSGESTRLHCVCMVGIPADIQDFFELSKKAGIGRWVLQNGNILRQENSASHFTPAENVKVQREFEILNCQVAIPINDREKTIGVAVLGGHLTRIGFTDEELQLLFHLMEELGLSVKNCWLHQQLSWNNQLFNEVFSSMRSGNMVVGPDLEILHANPAILSFLGKDNAGTELDFSDIPRPLAAKIHEAVEQRTVSDPFFLSLPENGDRLFRITLIPLNQGGESSQAVMAVMEDFTEIESAKKVAVEASNLRLTALIAKRFAHEIRNSLVPLTTHLQLMDHQYDQPGFRASMKKALGEETERISRFTEQMLFLSQPPLTPGSVLALEKVLRESFAEAQEHTNHTGTLNLQGVDGWHLRCHPQSLRHAFKEIFINALQSSREETHIDVTAHPPAGEGPNKPLTVRFRDTGTGFSPEIAERATEPFFTTRNTGIGLGLTIARKIIENHQGMLETACREESDADVIVTLAAESIHHG